MYTLEQIHNQVAENLEKGHFVAMPATLYEPIDYIMSIGGKRLRPVLLIMGAQLYGRTPDSVMDAALGIEVFHNFTLMHDDIMDHAPMRRGKPTVHTHWNINTAILSGDTMMVMAYDLLLRTKTDHILEVLHIFNQTAREVCEGQQYDMDFESREDVTLDEYMEMIRLKTSVLIAASLRIGGQIAGAPANDLENLYRFGEKIGLAFQLKDDLLDVFGDEKKFGKQTGNDIITNKKTFLLVRCLQDATAGDRETLAMWLGIHQKPAEKIEAVTNLFRKYQIEEKTNAAIEQLYREGVGFLEQVHTDESSKTPLYEMLDSLRLRDF